MNPLTLIVAGDPDQATGGYLYDARIAACLRQAGREVSLIGLAGEFPLADATARRAMREALAAEPDGRCVIIDGLALGTLGDIVAEHANRLSLVALIHHPLADEAGLDERTAATLLEAERRALSHVAHVIVTSPFTARRLRSGYAVSPDRLAVVEPGVAPPGPAEVARLDPPMLLTVATLIPRKGHRVLVEALARVADRAWQCRLIGDTERDPECTQAVREAISTHGLADRITIVGGQPPEALATHYRQAHAFVLPSFYEGYGMVVTEALSYGLPVITTTGGALADTLPRGAGIAVEPGTVTALADALARVLDDATAYRALSETAAEAGARLDDWPAAAARFAAIVDETVAAGR
ncbi:glycosyltransferase family 4 protein [Salinisphaera sp. Q1T1-3]|uniref:glycosyltransferase family 4 protein n=1 Tax=Salinisphaera sp. Q1T1-3 TaxID=2321229 RepID=UPI000E7444A3|nr:glycosyltransferase family 4 protein [Salinisphaera sp. Q1T1-3]RJS92756.1 glycosyltransferase family 1 protein [Salinisphaera sp. Q1T1-3]